MKENVQSIDKIVPDTSVIIEGLLSEKLHQGHLKAAHIIIHEAVLAEALARPLEPRLNASRRLCRLLHRRRWRDLGPRGLHCPPGHN